MGADCVMAKYVTIDDESISLPMITADQNDYDIGASGNLFRLSSDTERKITGIAFQSGTTTVRLVNVGAFDILLMNESGESETGNRIITGNGEDTILAPEGTALLTYDSESSMWRLIA